MNVEFFSGDPREPARSRLDEVLSKGGSQLAIACAFCADAGVKLLDRHLPRLADLRRLFGRYNIVNEAELLTAGQRLATERRRSMQEIPLGAFRRSEPCRTLQTARNGSRALSLQPIWS